MYLKETSQGVHICLDFNSPSLEKIFFTILYNIARLSWTIGLHLQNYAQMLELKHGLKYRDILMILR